MAVCRLLILLVAVSLVSAEKGDDVNSAGNTLETVDTVETGEITKGVREPFSKEEFPNPQQQFNACGRDKISWVCDPGRYLTPSEGSRLDNMVQFLRDAPTCLCDDQNDCYGDYRHEILIAVVPRIKYTDGTFPSAYAKQKLAAKEFAEYLRDESWVSEGKECRMRAFVVHDMHTKVIWTATNYFAFKVISDRKAKGVGLDVKTEFLGRGELFKGLESMIYQYRNFLFEEETPSPSPPPPAAPWWRPLVSAVSSILLLILLIVIFCAVCRYTNCVGGGLPGGVWFPSSGMPSFGAGACTGCGGGRGWGGGGGGGGFKGGWSGGGGYGGGGDGDGEGGGFDGGDEDGGGGGGGCGGADGDGGGGGCGGGDGAACGGKGGDGAKCGGGGGG